jgi:hypothetical protein
MKTIYLLILSGLFLIGCNQTKRDETQNNEKQQNKVVRTNPKIDGCIPNVQVAIKVAKAVWFPLYGKWVDSCKSLKAELSKDGVWKVYNKIPEDSVGVELYAYINKMDGKIIKVYGLSIHKSEQ